MEALNISIDVNVKFSSETKEFLTELVATAASVFVHNSCTSYAPVLEAKVAEAKVAEAKPAEAKPAEAKVGIEDVRSALALKVNDHRAAIKEKLNALGAPSVTKLSPEYYAEMLNFLQNL